MPLHKLTITVVDGGTTSTNWGSSPLKTENKKTDEKDSLLHKILNFNDTIKQNVKQSVAPTTFFALQSGVSLASQTAKQFINYYVSDIGRKNGDSNYQSMINRRIEQVSDPLSIGQGMLGGAAAGSMFGAVGAVIGATIGAASSGISLGFKYAERERAYAHEMFQQNNNQAYNLSRANFSALTGRVR